MRNQETGNRPRKKRTQSSNIDKLRALVAAFDQAGISVYRRNSTPGSNSVALDIKDAEGKQATINVKISTAQKGDGRKRYVLSARKALDKAKPANDNIKKPSAQVTDKIVHQAGGVGENKTSMRNLLRQGTNPDTFTPI